jgi:hypothetical protein
VTIADSAVPSIQLDQTTTVAKPRTRENFHIGANLLLIAGCLMFVGGLLADLALLWEVPVHLRMFTVDPLTRFGIVIIATIIGGTGVYLACVANTALPDPIYFGED